MNKTMIKIVVATILFSLTSVLPLFSQDESDFFYDKKYENGKIVSKIRYELGYSGLFEKEYLHEYVRNERGELAKEEVFKWNLRKSAWVPVYCITYQRHFPDNILKLEYAVWNKKEKKYGDASENALYYFDESGDVIAWNFFKGANKSYPWSYNSMLKDNKSAQNMSR